MIFPCKYHQTIGIEIIIETFFELIFWFVFQEIRGFEMLNTLCLSKVGFKIEKK